VRIVFINADLDSFGNYVSSPDESSCEYHLFGKVDFPLFDNMHEQRFVVIVFQLVEAQILDHAMQLMRMRQLVHVLLTQGPEENQDGRG
jgi:hypothetical protein